MCIAVGHGCQVVIDHPDKFIDCAATTKKAQATGIL